MPSRFVDLMVEEDFARARRGALRGAMLSAIARRPNTLLPYQEARRRLQPVGASYRGRRVVSIAQIVGSTDRARDFDRAFRPRGHHVAARWKRVARADYEGVSLPPVRLNRLGDAYFVADGHHRVSVARARGQAFIEAEIVEDVVREPRRNPAPRCRRGPWFGRRAGAWLVRMGAALQGQQGARPGRPGCDALCPTR